MSRDEIPRQPTISFRLTVEKNTSSPMTSPRRQHRQPTPELEAATSSMSASPRSPSTDWKLRCETLQFEHQLELERIRLHYEHELKEKVAEIRNQLKREYDYQFADLRTRLFDQYQQQLQNASSHSAGLDQSIGEQVREQVRLAQQFERDDDERRQHLLQQSTDSEEVKRLVNKLHREGVHVLTLSELLSLRLNGVNIKATDESIGTIQKLHEENALLRTLIGNMNANEGGTKLIKCVADIFRCEQERRLKQIRQHPKFEQLEDEIQDMCTYQRDALARLLSQDRLQLINELDQTKEQLNYLQERLEHFKQAPPPSGSAKFQLKYMRAENHRKSLIYQKRYLLVLLTGYEDTETYALNEIRRLTGESRPNPLSSPYSLNRAKTLQKKPYYQRASNPRFRLRSCFRVVIAAIRMRRLVKKWKQKLSTIK